MWSVSGDAGVLLCSRGQKHGASDSRYLEDGKGRKGFAPRTTK
jgi:hypothetical protein